MWQLVVGILVGMAMSAPSSWALRIARSPEFYEWNTNTFSQLNQFTLDVWNTLNGRYQVDIVTTDPDGSRRGNRGELVLYDPGASEEWCVNVDAATDWDCAALSQ